ncbi:MAG TPA: hypothetical protein VIJ51_15425 [Solirubrobacteraceae bacterium]
MFVSSVLAGDTPVVPVVDDDVVPEEVVPDDDVEDVLLDDVVTGAGGA